jgi:hypothetical protein
LEWRSFEEEVVERRRRETELEVEALATGRGMIWEEEVAREIGPYTTKSEEDMIEDEI